MMAAAGRAWGTYFVMFLGSSLIWLNPLGEWQNIADGNANNPLHNTVMFSYV